MGSQLKASLPTALSQGMGAHEALAGTLEILGPILDKDLHSLAWLQISHGCVW